RGKRLRGLMREEPRSSAPRLLFGLADRGSTAAPTGRSESAEETMEVPDAVAVVAEHPEPLAARGRRDEIVAADVAVVPPAALDPLGPALQRERRPILRTRLRRIERQRLRQKPERPLDGRNAVACTRPQRAAPAGRCPCALRPMIGRRGDPEHAGRTAALA